MNKDTDNMSNDFTDVEEEKGKSYIFLIIILYIIVAALTVLLVIGLKHQGDTIKNNASNSTHQNVETSDNIQTNDEIENQTDLNEETITNDEINEDVNQESEESLIDYESNQEELSGQDDIFNLLR
jgi:flagellar basal body-associated protein FliL